MVALETMGTEGLYAHLFAHWALAEALVLSQEAYDGGCAEGCDLTLAQIQAAAESATAFTVYADRDEGGWRYWPWNGDGGNHGDMSHAPVGNFRTTSLEEAGLQAAMSDFQLNKLGNFINSHGTAPVSDNSSGTSVATRYCYHTFHDRAYAPRPTVCGLVTRALLQKTFRLCRSWRDTRLACGSAKFFEGQTSLIRGRPLLQQTWRLAGLHGRER